MEALKFTRIRNILYGEVTARDSTPSKDLKPQPRLGFFYAYMDVGKEREQERKLCPWMDGMSQGARDGGVHMPRAGR